MFAAPVIGRLDASEEPLGEAPSAGTLLPLWCEGFRCRLDRGAPQKLQVRALLCAEFRRRFGSVLAATVAVQSGPNGAAAEAEREQFGRQLVTCCQFRAAEAGGLCHLSVYHEGSLSAEMQFTVVILVESLEPIVLGRINCASKQLEVVAPRELAELEPGTRIRLCVFRSEPALAWRSAGEAFERFAEELMDQWRTEIMGAVLAATDAGQLDGNRRLTDSEMVKLLAAFHPQPPLCEAPQQSTAEPMKEFQRHSEDGRGGASGSSSRYCPGR